MIPYKINASFKSSPKFTFAIEDNWIVCCSYDGSEFGRVHADEVAGYMYQSLGFTWREAYMAGALDVDGYGFIFAHTLQN